MSYMNLWSTDVYRISPDPEETITIYVIIGEICVIVYVLCIVAISA